MTPLRRRMLEDMGIRNLAANTQLCYVKQVAAFARYFGRSPEQLGPEEVRIYQIGEPHDRSSHPAYAIFLLRLCLGAMFIAHAMLKVRVFTIPGTVKYFESLGLPGFFACITITAELGGAAGLILGI